MHGKRTPARLPPRLNRGSAAWDRSDESDFSAIWLSSRHSLVLPVVTRAQVHAVTDTTNQEYLAIIEAVLDEIQSGIRQRKWNPPSSLVELDAILSAIVDALIYVQRKGPAYGQKLHAAWSHVYPNQVSELHSFSRSCQGWNRMLPGSEGSGLCAERWGAIGRVLLSFPSSQARESAIWWFLQADCYCREQDLEMLLNTDSDWVCLERPSGHPDVCLFFGVPTRGESSKTSVTSANQSVIVERAWVARLFLELVRKRPPNSPIFSVSRETVARNVKRACDLLGIECPVLHRLRHTGPANDTLRESKSLEQIRRRGRWASLKSVERYSKTAHIVADLAKLPAEVRKLGEELLANPEAFTKAPIATVRFS
jgi:hypothetical protein